MQILVKPTLYTLSGNCSDIIVNSPSSFDFSLTIGSTSITERYTPNANARVTIKLKALLEELVPSAPKVLSGSIESIPITKVVYKVGDIASETFYCVNGGMSINTDAATFFRSNFLTWRPQVLRTTFHAPQSLAYVSLGNCVVKAKGKIGDVFETVIIAELSSGYLYNIDVTFGNIRSKFSAQPSFVDIWIEGNEIKTYTQRFVLISDNLDQDIFQWVNSLGGIDTAIFTGNLEQDGSPKGFTAAIDNNNIEYQLEVNRSFKKYTGYLADVNTSRWVLDLFNSVERYHLYDGQLIRIIISKPTLKSTKGSVLGYEFEFAHSKQSKYINIPRLADDQLLIIEDPNNAELFFLEPRLNSFAIADITADLLIPTQNSNLSKWLRLPLVDIFRYFDVKYANINHGHSLQEIDGIEGGVNNGKPAKHAKQHHTYAEDEIKPYDIDAAKKDGDGDQDFTAKNLAVKDELTAVIGRLRDLIASGNVGSADFVSGLLGTGWNIDAKGNAEMDSLSLRTFLYTPELVKNQVRVIGTQAWLTESGVVKRVVANPRFRLNVCNQSGRPLVSQYNGKYYIEFHEENANGWFRKDDILKGIYNFDNGFYTLYLRVAGAICGGYLIEPINGYAPASEMVLARFGNYSDTTRQGSVYFDSAAGYIRILGGVNSTEINVSNIKFQGGNLRGLRIMGIDNMPDDGVFAPGLAVLSSQVVGLDGQLTEHGNALNEHGDKLTNQAETIKLQSAKLEVLATGISTKVEEGTFDALGERVTTAESAIVQTSIAVSSKVEQTTFNALGKRVTNAESAITQTALAVSSKVEQTTFNALGERVTNAESAITQTAKEISLKVSKDDLEPTGINIEHKKITLNGDTQIYDNDGKPVALFKDGKIKATLIETEAITAVSIDTRPVNPNGTRGEGVVISQGWDNMQYYDANGQIVMTTTIGGRHSGLATNSRYIQGEYMYEIGASGVRVLKLQGDGVQEVAKLDRYGIYLPPSAKVDIPGVALAGYKVNPVGSILSNSRFGAKRENVGNATYEGDGIYKIPHNIGHSNYNVVVAFEVTNDNWFGVWKPIEYGNTYVKIKLADLGSDPVQRAFSITFFGNN